MAAAESVAERRRRDEQVRATINQKLVDTGEKERLKELLRTRLMESGWFDDMKGKCKDVIKSKGLEKITVDKLVTEIMPYGRSTVPESVKTELLERIRTFLQSN